MEQTYFINDIMYTSVIVYQYICPSSLGRRQNRPTMHRAWGLLRYWHPFVATTVCVRERERASSYVIIHTRA